MNIEIIIYFVIAIALWIAYGVTAICLYKECSHQQKLIEKTIKNKTDCN